jgi:hypothetical protein
MKIHDETLMAYIDGELDDAARADMETALHEDPVLADRAARHRKLRSQLESAYAAELEEPVPDRLLEMLRSTSGQGTSVADLGARRARAALKTPAARWNGVRLTSMAAGLLLAVAGAVFLWHGSQSILERSADGSLVARGALAQGLSDQLSGDSPSASGVTVGLSFVAKSGDYCRTFSIAHGTEGAGLACRRNDHWQISVFTQPEAGGPGGSGTEYRTAGSSIPPAVLAAVQAEISGDPLDLVGEIAARERDWRPVR